MVLYMDLDESLLLEIIVAIANLEQISTPVLCTEIELTNSEMVTGISTCCSTDASQRRALLQDVYVALCIVVAAVAFHMMASDESDFTVCSSTVVENSPSQVTGCCRCYPAIDNSVPRLVTGMKPWSFGHLSTRYAQETDFAHAQETDSNTTCAQIVHGTFVRPLGV